MSKNKTPKKIKADDAPVFEQKKISQLKAMEYRALLAEWKLSLTEASYLNSKLEEEKKLPKYQELFNMMAIKTRLDSAVKEKGEELQQLQEEVARGLGISFEQFRSEYVIDLETGAVNQIIKNDS